MLSARYRRLQNLVAGDTVVCTAQDLVLGGACVVKYVPASSSSASTLREEGRLLADLEHPRLVRLIETFDDADGLAEEGPSTGHITEWVDGDPLTGAAKSLAEGVALYGGLLQVVSYLHHRGLLHLDLKPDNALATETGVVLLDLGTARPLDGRPGEAGGTLGYAAPEVLAGGAASVASDLYSLGAILYELTTGFRPHGEHTGRALRQAVLAGNVVPVRAVAREVPRPLARLTESMLAREPARRPRSVDEVVEELREVGFAVPAVSVGAPPFVGRERELEALLELAMDRRHTGVAVVGERGSGRTRLVRRALQAIRDRGRRVVVDLGDAEGVPLALHRLLSLDDDDLPPPGPGWEVGVRRRLARPLSWSGVLFLGRREELKHGDRASVEGMLPALADAGVTVIWAAGRGPPGLRLLPLPALSRGDLETIGRFVGMAPGSAVLQAEETSGGLPGPLLRALSEHPAADELLTPDAQRAFDVLCTLPSGIPRQVIDALPDLTRVLPLLLLSGFARWRAGSLFLDRARPDVVIHRDIAEQVSEVLRGRFGELDPLWAALTAARLGWIDQASRLLEGATEVAGSRRRELVELVRRLAEAGGSEAAVHLARLQLADGNNEAAIEAIALVAQPDPDVLALRIRALRLAGRLVEARDVASAEAGRLPHPEVLLELAHSHFSLGDIDSAEQALDQAVDLDPAILADRSLALRVSIAVRRLDAGEAVPGLEALLRRVEAAEHRRHLPASTLSACGRILAREGRLERAAELHLRAARRADEAGDLQAAAFSRLNQGNVLMRLGKGRLAREAFSGALLIARAIDQERMLVRICSSLAELELRSGRLAAAERYLAEFREVAQQIGGREVRVRGALLQAWAHQLAHSPRDVLAVLDHIDGDTLPAPLRVARALFLAQAKLELDQPDEAMALVESLPVPDDGAAAMRLRVVTGRVHLALARRSLALARASVPDDPDPLEHVEVGEVLLASAGEDLDPGSFADRRRDLGRAARMMKGLDASRAATLRDRLLEGPGAALEGVVQLTEAMNDPQRFPAALARLVDEALGAHRVLIMLRLPGLGRQVTYRELSGQEAAGIGQEVMRRIQRPDDVWRAGDAFADPRLREASATVRTFEIRSLLAVAIPHEGRAIGALYVDDLHRRDRFSDEDVDILQRLARAVATMVDLLPSKRQYPVAFEPTRVLGVYLPDREQTAELESVLERLASRDEANLLLTGPTGAGKSWLARQIATEVLRSEGLEEVVLRRGNPEMLVSALAGTQPGEFTGAVAGTGAIHRALEAQRVLLLDEVQALDGPGQEILLPLLEHPRRFGTLTGSAGGLAGPIHIILITNADVSLGRWRQHFRPDLWYRMAQLRVHLPPLWERGREVIYRYLAEMLAGKGLGAPERVLDIAALHRVTNHPWEGNLRELGDFASSLAHMYRRANRPLTTSDLRRCGLRPEDQPEVESARATGSVEALESITVEAVLKELRRENWVQAAAARSLGITATRLHRILGRAGLLDEVRAKRQLSRN